MVFTDIWKDACSGLHSVERMRAILHRERVRSDRGCSQFALLTLTLPKGRDTHNLAALARVVCERTRETDDAGLLGPCSVGVALPETPAEGAWKLAADLCALLPADVPRPTCDVYLYPTRPCDGDRLETVQAATNRHASNGHATANGGAKRPNGRCGARPMQTFFTRRPPGWKRAMDVLGASVALVLLGPLMLLVAGAIRLTSPGPAIFTQRRQTIGGRGFTIYKFRTMTADAELRKPALRAFNDQDGPAFKIADDPRVTKLGRLLRKTSVDELPQLFNVLKGDMSLVGPRPLTADESSLCEVWHRRQLDVTAGLTGIWQVRGRSSVPFPDRIRMDIRYIQSQSLVNDLKLIAQTIPAVLLRQGAY